MESQITERVNERIAKVDEELDKFEAKLGLPSGFNVTDNVEKYLNLDFSTAKLDATEYSEGAACLSQYSFYLQRAANKEQSRILQLEYGIMRVITPSLKQQSSWAWQERRASAIYSDEVAKELEKQKNEAEIRLARISFLSGKVEKLSEKYTELSRVVRQRSKEN